jgi:arylsulfatase
MTNGDGGPAAGGATGFGGVIGRTVRESTPWWPAAVRPPDGSPNVILVLLDDMGFGDIGPYGSEIPTPTLDRLARDGLRFTNHHTAPLCSPARAAIQTGLNPHRAGFAGVANFDPGFPGWTMEIDPSVETLPEALRAAGYATYAVGKWHLTRDGAMHGGAPGARGRWRTATNASTASSRAGRTSTSRTSWCGTARRSTSTSTPTATTSPTTSPIRPSGT